MPIFEFDIRWCKSHDLTLRRVQRILRGWIRGGLIGAVWLGTPCNSFSRARERGGAGPPPLRSNAYPRGLPHLLPHDAEKVRVGNLLCQFSASLFLLCRSLGIPCAMENPATSRLWLMPAIASCRALTNVHNCLTDYCGFGTPWRKRTALMSVHLDLRSCVRRCTGKGTCSFSCKKHVQLVGQHNGQFLTLIAEPYPAGLCRSICQCFVYALKQHQLNALERLL